MKCFNCLENMQLNSTSSTSIFDDYYCRNYSCNYLFSLELNEKDIIYYHVTKQSGGNCYELAGDREANYTKLYLSKITIKTSFINVSLDNLPNDIPNLVNRLFKLKAFI